MSTAVIDSTNTTATQLCFSWGDELTPETPELKRTSPRLRSDAVRPGVIPAPRLYKDVAHESQANVVTEAIEPAQPLVSPLTIRGTGEVRLGTVMIKLLKRYGITDEEIAAGLSSYAQKQCQSSAS